MSNRPRLTFLVAAILCVVGVACLGQDFRSVELTLTEWDHGWRAVVEPDQQFSVTFRENPQYANVEWVIADIDPPIVDVVGYVSERPEDVPEEDLALAIWGFDLVGTALGEATASFEIVVDGRTVDRVHYTIAVVEDACDGDDGLTAPRCERRHQEFWPQGLFEWDHGRTIDVASGEIAAVQLTGNAVHPDAVWELADSDTSVVDVSQPRDLETRTPGNWDTTDIAEPGSFLPRWEFLVTARAPGASLVRFEMHRGGDLLEFCEFTFNVTA